MSKKLQKLWKSYGHALLPLIYGPIYLLVFFYLEKRPVQAVHIIEMEIDRKIPFCEYFVIPYYLWFLYIAATVVVFVFLDKKDFYKLCLTLGTGMTLFLIVSYIYPNGLLLRPTEFARDNFCVSLVKALYKTDTATNVFPSIHCFNSMAANAAICHNKKLGQNFWIRNLSMLLSFSIILSTLFIKQHSFFDLLTAFALFVVLYIPVYFIPALKEKREAGGRNADVSEA